MSSNYGHIVKFLKVIIIMELFGLLANLPIGDNFKGMLDEENNSYF
jgi:hypothetical protein